MKSTSKRVIPGFGFSFSFTMIMLCLIVLIPLCSLVIYTSKIGFGDFLFIITEPRVVASYLVTLETSFIAAVVNGVMGLIIAWVLVRCDFPLKSLINSLIELPFALPTAVAGISLAYLTSMHGPVGKIAAHFGLKIAYTRLGMIIALIFVGFPFVVRTLQPVLEKVDATYEEAAAMLGATSRYTFLHVLIPEILPAFISGITMGFARGLGEYGAVVFIAGNQPYKTEITAILVMSKLSSFDYSSATSIALVMLVMSFLILFLNAFYQSKVSKKASV
jgi:sulfate transport system permease protein